MQRKYIWFVITALVLLAGYGLVNRRPVYRSVVISPAVAAPDFSIADHNGSPFQMSAMRGKVVLLYFGFTNCPDECPLTMAHLKQAFQIIGSASQDVKVVMVSTDPGRDTPQALKNFLGNFSPTFIGIPGTPAQLSPIWQDYQVEVLDGGETHSSYTYVVDRKGVERLAFKPDTSPSDMASDLKMLLDEK
jgi:protein SCO1/2